MVGLTPGPLDLVLFLLLGFCLRYSAGRQGPRSLIHLPKLHPFDTYAELHPYCKKNPSFPTSALVEVAGHEEKSRPFESKQTWISLSQLLRGLPLWLRPSTHRCGRDALFVAGNSEHPFCTAAMPGCTARAGRHHLPFIFLNKLHIQSFLNLLSSNLQLFPITLIFYCYFYNSYQVLIYTELVFD